MPNACPELLDRWEAGAASPPAAYPRARVALSTLFLIDGLGFGTWAALIPSFKHKFALGDTALSVALFALVTGALVAMPLAGQAVARWGGRRVAVGIAFLFCATLPLLAWAPAFGWFALAAGCFGAAKGAFDVSINSHAVVVENAGTRPVMSSFQALWSLGGLFSASAIGFALGRGWTPESLMTGVALLLGVLALSTVGRLLPERGAAAGAPAGFRWPDATLFRLGLLAFLALFAEGVLMDWSAVYARAEAGAAIALAPLAYAAYSLAMAAGRLLGDAVIARLGAARVLRLSGLLAAAGVGLVVFIQALPATFPGLVIAGLGLSNLVAIIFGAAGRAHPGGAGPGVATASTMGYLGFLVGPPLIGLISAVAGLPAAFALVIIFGLVISTAGVAVLRRSLPQNPS